MSSLGDSYETAIIMGGESHSLLIRERQWITETYHNWTLTSQQLCIKDNKNFDVFTIKLRDKREIKIFFDITKVNYEKVRI